MPERDPMTRRSQDEYMDAEALAEFGRVNRELVGRRQLAIWVHPETPRDPVAWILSQESTRIPEFLPLRHYRMAQSPFAFYRGSAIVMAHDLATGRPHTDLEVQLCGDAHLCNFGLFAAPNRELVLDINDFDETQRGPFEWDVFRLVTSFVLASKERGFPEHITSEITLRVGQSYREKMRVLSEMSDVDIWYQRADEDHLKLEIQALHGKKGVSRLKGHLEKAKSRENWSAVLKMTEVVEGRRRFVNQSPLLIRIPLGESELDLQRQLYLNYVSTLPPETQAVFSRYRPIDVAHKVVGVGSVGLLSYIYLLQGRHPEDLLVIQVKEARESVLSPFVESEAPPHQGQRVVYGQKMLQPASDLFLGWISGPEGRREFYVRQLRDMKWTPDLQSLSADSLLSVAHLCGETLARAHARSGSAIAISAYLGKSSRFDRAMLDFARSYSHQVEADFDAFTARIADGSIVAQREVDISAPIILASRTKGIQVASDPNRV